LDETEEPREPQIGNDAIGELISSPHSRIAANATLTRRIKSEKVKEPQAQAAPAGAFTAL
jgi:hypothetical protein